MAGLDQFTKLLLHCNGANGSTTITDSAYISPDCPHTCTAVGTAQLSNDGLATRKFNTTGGLCTKFDGNSDYLSSAASSDWNLGIGDGTGNFTLDCLFYIDAENHYNTLFSVGNPYNDDGDFYVWVDTVDKKYYFWVGHYGGGGAATLSVYSDAVTINLNTWYHFALVRSTSSIYMYHNGTKLNTTMDYGDGTQQVGNNDTLRIGATDWGGSGLTHFLSGFVEEARISNNARWTAASFTVPTAPYTSDANTKLLLHFEALNFLTDSSGSAHVITKYGTTKQTPSRFGTGSLALDGNSDYVTSPDSTDWYFGAGDFTIDTWLRLNVYPGDVYSYQTLLSYQTDDDHGWWWDLTGPDGSLRVRFRQAYSNAPGWDFDVNWDLEAIQTNTWHHIAVERYGTYFYGYLDGVKLTKTLATGEPYSGEVKDWANFYLGWASGKPGAIQVNDYLNGNLDEFRISKGIARYKGNDFDPPVREYTTGRGGPFPVHFNE